MAGGSAERKEPVTRGTGNVLADLGFPDAAERQAKLRLAYALNQVLEARKLSQADAAKVLAVTQPRYLRFVTTSWRTFSVERLVDLLTAHGQDVEIVIRDERTRPDLLEEILLRHEVTCSRHQHDQYVKCLLWQRYVLTVAGQPPLLRLQPKGAEFVQVPVVQ
jgi:predicted XRE-type DNA-binding protein